MPGRPVPAYARTPCGAASQSADYDYDMAMMIIITIIITIIPPPSALRAPLEVRGHAARSRPQ